jgi:CubicO group peptidase (beta-lactamase class C family)
MLVRCLKFYRACWIEIGEFRFHRAVQVMTMPLNHPYQVCAAILVSMLLLGGCDDDSDSKHKQVEPQYDFSAIDARFQQFLDGSEVYDGISYTLVDAKQGVVHEVALGDQSLGIVVLLASASKMPAASLLMALNDGDALDFDVERPIENYLPWEGVYGDRTIVHLLSNTSGIPGLVSLVLGGPDGPHSCQLDTDTLLELCAEIIYSTELTGTLPPETKFDYGGSQWQLAGGVAEQVSNKSWRQAFDEYIAEPCRLEVFQYGNLGVDWSILGFDTAAWTGNPDSLTGLDNPSIEGGAISNLQDYARLLLMHLRNGKCDEGQVMSPTSVDTLQLDRTSDLPGNFTDFSYGMGWWISQTLPGVVMDPGLYGSIGWLDTERGIGGFVAIDDYSYTLINASQNPERPLAPPAQLVIDEIIQLHQQAVDEARDAVSE